MFTANGTLYDSWVPSGGETDFVLSPLLEPLSAFRSKLLVLANVDLDVAMDSPGIGHQVGIGSLFTGRKLDTLRLFGSAGWATGPSVDQVVAAKIGATSKIGSLQLGVQPPNDTVSDRISYRDAAQPLPPQCDPVIVYNMLFSSFDADPVVLEKRRVHRKSVLDFVRGELSAVSNRVGADDRKRLDAHATSIREIETRLDAVWVPGATCHQPSALVDPDLFDPSSLPDIGRLQMDLLAMALICDLTRVASLQWSSAASPAVFTWLGITLDHHELSHKADADEVAMASLEAILHWYSEQFAYLLGKLDAAQEAGGSVLDRTVVLWGNEMGKGSTHDFHSAPFVMAGSAGGYFRTGRFLDRQHESHNNLLLSIAQAYGVEGNSFGDPAYCTGPMSGLT
jgi:hypothetical protein